MNISDDPLLDQEELIHCAILAGEQQEHDKALSLLKQALQASEDARIYLLMAAQHAELRMYERAINGMKKAVSIDPELWVAQFQLAQLYVTAGLNDDARKQWAFIMESSKAPEYLKLFSNGLSDALNEQVSTAVNLLQQGIEQNSENPPLSLDMQKIIDHLQKQQDDHSDQIAASESPSETAVSQLLLSKYKQ